MKSLEIIDDLIWKTQKKYDYVDTNQDKKQLEKQLEELNSEFNKLQQIKQDLEVLEILRKHLSIVEMSNNWIEIDLYEEDQKEDFNKVKQWLEENEE